jgi:hypothetical protein
VSGQQRIGEQRETDDPDDDNDATDNPEDAGIGMRGVWVYDLAFKGAFVWLKSVAHALRRL